MDELKICLKKFLGHCDVRKFKSHFGISPVTTIKIYEKITSVSPLVIEHLLIALHFLKVYPTTDVGSSFWKLDPKTYRKRVWFVLYLLFFSLDEIHFDDRLESGVHTINVVLDATEIQIQRPSTGIQRIFYSGKKKKHTIKYEVAATIRHPIRIVWIAGPVYGSMHDLKLTRNQGLLDHLLPHEKILADLGYYGDPHFITPYKGKKQTDKQKQLSYKLGQIRVMIEHINEKLKVFQVLCHPWRHDVDLHKIVFWVICDIISIEFEIHPVHQHEI